VSLPPSLPALRVGAGLVDLQPVKPEVLAVRTIAGVDPQLAEALKVPPWAEALGFLTCTSDDALYVALDEGTKAAPVEVIYAKSFYAGAAHASGPLSGEVIGCYAGRDLDEVRAALAACEACLRDEAWFYAADDAGRLCLFPHVVRSTGRYLSKEAGIAPGEPMAYLIAPPIEAMIGLDAALKAGGVRLLRFFGPPTETNFAGAYLGGELPACEAAARAFAAAVADVARAPREADRQARGAGEALPRGQKGEKTPGQGKYRVLATGERLLEKPEHLTHLRDDESLVGKGHPRMVLRGKLDVLEGLLLDAQVAASAEGEAGLVGDLEETLGLVRKMVGCEVTGAPLGPWRLLGLEPGEIRTASHHTYERYGVPFMYPSVNQGKVVARLYLARAFAREAELAAYGAFPAPAEGPGERADLKLALNRLSSALYVMQCKHVGGHYGAPRRPGPVRGWRPPK
jgi:ethanolamine utilization protein EutL